LLPTNGIIGLWFHLSTRLNSDANSARTAVSFEANRRFLLGALTAVFSKASLGTLGNPHR
jgi:hypothetical protein